MMSIISKLLYATCGLAMLAAVYFIFAVLLGRFCGIGSWDRRR